MEKFALMVRLDAQAGREAEVEAFLRSALPLVAEEPGTRSWYALRMAPEIFGIFDTFDSESGRQAHLAGKIAQALSAQASQLLARPPVIEKIAVVAAHHADVT